MPLLLPSPPLLAFTDGVGATGGGGGSADTGLASSSVELRPNPLAEVKDEGDEMEEHRSGDGQGKGGQDKESSDEFEDEELENF